MNVVLQGESSDFTVAGIGNTFIFTMSSSNIQASISGDSNNLTYNLDPGVTGLTFRIFGIDNALTINGKPSQYRVVVANGVNNTVNGVKVH